MPAEIFSPLPKRSKKRPCIPRKSSQSKTTISKQNGFCLFFSSQIPHRFSSIDNGMRARRSGEPSKHSDNDKNRNFSTATKLYNSQFSVDRSGSTFSGRRNVSSQKAKTTPSQIIIMAITKKYRTQTRTVPMYINIIYQICYIYKCYCYKPTEPIRFSPGLGDSPKATRSCKKMCERRKKQHKFSLLLTS